MNLEKIKNIIFDLGNVVIDIDPSRTINSFKNAGFTDIESFLSHSKSKGFMSQFQEGKIDNQTFRDQVRYFAQKPLSDSFIVDAWNAMLLDYDIRRIEKLLELKEKYQIFLFSNTNAIHYNNFANRVPVVNSLDSLFHKTYYSHVIGLSKPSINSFEYVLSHAEINANETLFLDDLSENIEGATGAGLNAKLVEYPNQWLEWL